MSSSIQVRIFFKISFNSFLENNSTESTTTPFTPSASRSADKCYPAEFSTQTGLRVESSALNILVTITFCVTFDIQHDGPGDDDSELSDETDSDESEADQNPATNQTNRQEDEESLNSADDVSGTDATEIFETGSVFILFNV